MKGNILLQRLRDQEKGMTSLYASLVIMSILSLMVFSFAQFATTSHKEMVDSHMNVQAHYAAETAINDVRHELYKQLLASRQLEDGGFKIELDAAPALAASSVASAGDKLGSSVAISGDYLAIGAPQSDSSAGAAYVWVKQSTDDNWNSSQYALLNKQDVSSLTAGSRFASALALNGGLLAVGAPGYNGNMGAVYLFTHTGTSWKPSAHNPITLGTAANPGDRFGASLAIRNEMLLIGAPGAKTKGAVYRFELDAGRYRLQRTLSADASSSNNINISLPVGAKFGSSLSFSHDRLAVGAPGADSNQGAVYVFKQTPSSWSLTATIKKQAIASQTNHADLSAGDLFGQGLTLNSNLLVIGAPGADSANGGVYVFEIAGSDWMRKGSIFSKNPSGSKEINVLSKISSQGAFGSALAGGSSFIAVGEPGADLASKVDRGLVHFIKIDSNDILSDIWAAGASGRSCPKREDVHPAWSNGYLTQEGNIEYLCVVVDLSPQEIVFDTVSTDRSLVMPLEPIDQATGKDLNLSELTIAWDQANPYAQSPSSVLPNSAGKTSYTSFGSWETPVPLMRMQLTIVNIDEPFNRSNLNNNTQVFYLYPDLNSNVKSYASHAYPKGSALSANGQTKQASVLTGNCVDEIPKASKHAFSCQVTLTGLPTAKQVFPGKDGRLVYVLRLQPIYASARVHIGGTPTTTTPNWGFRNIQAQVTATGRVGHILQRIEERMPLRPLQDLPEYGLDSEESICKILVNESDRGAYLHTKTLGRLSGDSKSFANLKDLPRSCWLRDSDPDWTS